MSMEQDSRNSQELESETARPVGQGNYVVKQGDCMNSIAFEAGFAPDTLWNHPRNAELKSVRKNMDVLFPGDRVFIPELQEKQESRPTDQHHRFRRRWVPAKLRLRFVEFQEPRGNEDYTIEIDGTIQKGVTSGDGSLEVSLPPNAEKAVVLLGPDQDRFEFDIGQVDPIESISGVQARLNNLHYHCGSNDGMLGPMTRRALKQFQGEHGLPETGEMNEETRSKLKDMHGC